MLKNENQSELWPKLASFEINEGDASFTYEKRLARENGWSAEYTSRVVGEYRRFLYLCAAAGHPCSPSDAVDQAWHLHMIYTESYWERLTPLLPRPLHHQPSKGGESETAKFEDWYAQTLHSYRLHFGEEPPLDIWPLPGLPVQKHTIQVDPRDNLVIPRRIIRTTVFASVVLSLALLASVAFADTDFSKAEKGLLAVIGFVLVGVVFFIAYQFDRRQSPDNRYGGTGCGTHTASCGGSCSGGGDGGGGCGGGCGGGGCGSS